MTDYYSARHDGRRGTSEDAPAWLAALLHRWHRLHDLERAALRYSPVFPVLSPLALDAALTTPGTRVAELAFGAYRALGSKVSRLILAVREHCRDPDGDHAELAQHLEAALPRGRLAKLLASTPIRHMIAHTELHTRLWQLPGARACPREGVVEAASKLPVDDEVHAQVAEAFVGAYYLSEGAFFSAHQFLLWLLDGSGVEEEKPWEQAVVGHLLFGSQDPFRGRTPSYLDFYEAPAEDDTSEKALWVRYDEEGSGQHTQPFWAEYRRSQPWLTGKQPGRVQPIECFPKIGGKQKFEPLAYGHKENCFVSYRLPGHEGKPYPVPNKVTSWLLGKSVITGATCIRIRQWAGLGGGYTRESLLFNLLLNLGYDAGHVRTHSLNLQWVVDHLTRVFPQSEFTLYGSSRIL